MSFFGKNGIAIIILSTFVVLTNKCDFAHPSQQKKAEEGNEFRLKGQQTGP